MNSDKTASAHGLPEDSLLPRDTRRSLPLMMLRARDVVMARFRPFLIQHDLSEQQWRVLRVLGEVDQMDSREVAERACLMAPSLTRIVRALETRRLIVKRRHPDDARRIFLSITPAGIDLIRLLSREGRASFDEFRLKFGEERLELLLDMLSDIVALRQEK